MTDIRLIKASANALPLDDESVQTVVTSPPYWGLRQYAGEQEQVWGGDPEHAHQWGERRAVMVGRNDGDRETPGGRGGSFNGGPREATSGAFCACGAWYGALGLEPTPELYVAHMVEVFREVKRVLRPDGTLWMNLGDSYAQSSNTGGTNSIQGSAKRVGAMNDHTRAIPPGLKPKDLVGIPWMVAFALRADGWYLRSDIIWHKPNPMPESVTDRPTKAHEYLFLLSKSGDAVDWRHRDGRWVRTPDPRPEPDYRWIDNRSADRGNQRVETDIEPLEWRSETYEDEDGKERKRWSRVNLWAGFDYFYDNEAVKEQASTERWPGIGPKHGESGQRLTSKDAPYAGGMEAHEGRNKRTVWTVATRPYSGAHFATYPEDLIEPCILAGSAVGDTVLDPFNGSGTTGVVAVRHNRHYVGVDISDEYLDLARERINGIQRGFPWEAA